MMVIFRTETDVADLITEKLKMPVKEEGKDLTTEQLAIKQRFMKANLIAHKLIITSIDQAITQNVYANVDTETTSAALMWRAIKLYVLARSGGSTKAAFARFMAFSYNTGISTEANMQKFTEIINTLTLAEEVIPDNLIQEKLLNSLRTHGAPSSRRGRQPHTGVSDAWLKRS